MREDKLYQKLKQKMLLVSSLPPQEVGLFTPIWKNIAIVIKNRPITVFTFSAFLTSLLIWFLLGTTAIVKVVTILQYGF